MTTYDLSHDLDYPSDDPSDDGTDIPARRRRTGKNGRRVTASDLEGPAPGEPPGRGRQDDRSDGFDDLSGLPPDGLTEDDLPDGVTYSSWFGSEHGPTPRPEWVITDHNALDVERGVVKTGKEADVHLVERWLPGTDAVTLLAAKRYRSNEHRQFHRDAGYLEGRRVRRSREMRAMQRRTEFGREVIAGQWARAEFGALSRLWSIGFAGGRALVPYPVQLDGTEILMEFMGTPDGVAAPRLAALRPDGALLADLWEQMLDALGTLALAGYAHGDLSAYNLLVHEERLVLIDLPQVVDVVGNPQGPAFLARDVQNVATWFVGHGLPEHLADVGEITARLLGDAGLR